MLKKDLTLQIINGNVIPLRERCLKEKLKNVIGLMRDELGGKMMTKFVGLIDDGSEDKKAKGTERCVIKRKLKFEKYKNCLEATELENKINYLGKKKIDIDSIKEFIKSNKSILKVQKRV